MIQWSVEIDDVFIDFTAFVHAAYYGYCILHNYQDNLQCSHGTSFLLLFIKFHIKKTTKEKYMKQKNANKNRKYHDSIWHILANQLAS